MCAQRKTFCIQELRLTPHYTGELLNGDRFVGTICTVNRISVWESGRYHLLKDTRAVFLHARTRTTHTHMRSPAPSLLHAIEHCYGSAAGCKTSTTFGSMYVIWVTHSHAYMWNGSEYTWEREAGAHLLISCTHLQIPWPQNFLLRLRQRLSATRSDTSTHSFLVQTSFKFRLVNIHLCSITTTWIYKTRFAQAAKLVSESC